MEIDIIKTIDNQSFFELKNSRGETKTVRMPGLTTKSRDYLIRFLSKCFDKNGNKILEESEQPEACEKLAPYIDDGELTEDEINKMKSGNFSSKPGAKPKEESVEAENPIKKEDYELAESILSEKDCVLTKQQKKELISSILAIGTDRLKYLKQYGLKITVVDPEKEKDDELLWGKNPLSQKMGMLRAGYYNFNDREMRLCAGADKNTVVHELAHAVHLSYLLDFKNGKMVSSYSFEKDEINLEGTKLQKLYDAYVKRCKEAENKAAELKNNGGADAQPAASSQWSKYAKSSPMEYFAEAFTHAALENTNDGAKYADLKELDPGMYKYIVNQEYIEDIENMPKTQLKLNPAGGIKRK